MNTVEYEAIPEKFEAFQAPIAMRVLDRVTEVLEGQWVVLYHDGSLKEVVDADVFAKKYRTPLLPPMPCGRPHSDFGQWPNAPWQPIQPKWGDVGLPMTNLNSTVFRHGEYFPGHA